MKFLIIGAGLTGAVIARMLADEGHKCEIIEKANHIAGNCYTKKDQKTDILMHCFGPHTLHSDNNEVWKFLERFAEIYPYRHSKQAWIQGELYPFPINLNAINKLFKTKLTHEEAEDFIKEQTKPYAVEKPKNFEEAALASVGCKLYEAYYKGYTKKQWGHAPNELPSFIFRRLPIHLNDEKNVFHHAKQGQPVGGYTMMIEKMLDHPNIKLKINKIFDIKIDKPCYDHVFCSAPIDRYFNCSLGKLPYRTLDFKHEYKMGTYQECGTVNYCDFEIPHTRIVEHKHFWPWEVYKDTVITFESSRECEISDRPYYPIPSRESKKLFQRYKRLAESAENISFVGRLGTYRYLDMDKAIEEAMMAASITLKSIQRSESIPTFFYN